MLGLEAACLTAVLVAAWLLGDLYAPSHHPSDRTFRILVALAALAMGLQNASWTRMGALTIHTTHVTGTLTKLAEEVVALAFWYYRRTRGRLRARGMKTLRVAPRRRAVRQAWGLAGLWLGYVSGAGAGALTWRAWGLWAFVTPLAALLFLADTDAGGVP